MRNFVIILALQFALGAGFGLAIGWWKWKRVKKFPFPAPKNYLPLWDKKKWDVQYGIKK